MDERTAHIWPTAAVAYIQVLIGTKCYDLRVRAVHDQTTLILHSYQHQLKRRHKANYGTIRYGCPTASTEKIAAYLPVRHIIKINFFHTQESNL